MAMCVLLSEAYAAGAEALGWFAMQCSGCSLGFRLVTGLHCPGACEFFLAFNSKTFWIIHCCLIM